MAVSTMVGTAKKKYTVWHLVFLRSQEIIFKAVNVIYLVYFNENFFRFMKKFLPLLTL